MVELMMYKRTALWNMETVPAELLGKHNTKVGTWCKITVVSGQLKFEAIPSDNVITCEWLLEPEMDFPIVEPQAWHRVTLMTADTQFFIFISRRLSFLSAELGDGLWAVAVYLSFRLLFLRPSVKCLALMSLVTSFAVEFSQLIQTPWLVAVRQTTLGHLLLG